MILRGKAEHVNLGRRINNNSGRWRGRVLWSATPHLTYLPFEHLVGKGKRQPPEWEASARVDGERVLSRTAFEAETVLAVAVLLAVLVPGAHAAIRVVKIEPGSDTRVGGRGITVRILSGAWVRSGPTLR